MTGQPCCLTGHCRPLFPDPVRSACLAQPPDLNSHNDGCLLTHSFWRLARFWPILEASASQTCSPKHLTHLFLLLACLTESYLLPLPQPHGTRRAHSYTHVHTRTCSTRCSVLIVCYHAVFYQVDREFSGSEICVLPVSIFLTGLTQGKY